MTRFKKFWIVFVSFLPFSAGALPIAVAGLIAGGAAIVGFSIYRTNAPVDMHSALNFFSSCWSCQLFAEIMAVMSGLVPRAYSAIGSVVIPFAIGMTAVWFVWKLTSGYINTKLDDAWSLTSAFTTKLIKLSFIIALLVAPLPRMLTSVVIEPIFNIGLSINHVMADKEKLAQCAIATAIADPVSVDRVSASRGAFSPKLRHNLACEVAGVHQTTGLGLAVGWTMINMAFDAEYMHKLMLDIPFFPNLPMFFAGLLICALFFMALLPVLMYFLEIFITLSLDLIMLPLMMLSWIFDDWKIFPSGGRGIKNIINDVVNGTIGIAATCVLLAFMLMFLDAVAGGWDGLSVITTAIEQNDSQILLDGLMMNNDSIIKIIILGVFFAMFMSMIPALIKTLFNVQLSDKFYTTTKNNLTNLWGKVKKWAEVIKK